MDTLSKILDFNLISIGDYKIKVYSLVIILLILLITKVIVQLIKKHCFAVIRGCILILEIPMRCIKLLNM